MCQIEPTPVAILSCLLVLWDSTLGPWSQASEESTRVRADSPLCAAMRSTIDTKATRMIPKSRPTSQILMSG